MKKNVASQIIGAQLVNATTGAAFTGSVTVYVTGDGGTQAAGSVGSGACTHEGNGFHTYAPAQAETNYDHIGFTFIGTGAVPATIQVYPTFPQTGDNFGRLGAPAGASVSADIAAAKVDTAAIKVKTDFLPSATAGAAGGLFIAGSNAATSVTTAFTANITGNLSGSVGSVTGLTAANLDVAISTRMATYTQPTGFLAATFPLTVASTTNITAGTITTVTNLTNAPTAGDLTATMKASVTAAVPTSATIAGAVWDITLASHLTAGTTGYALNAAGAAGDPWTTALPGAYGAGSAGYIIGTNINAAITSRMATYTQPTGFLAATFPGTVASTTNITAGTISTVTTLTNLPSIPANWLTAAGIAAGALDGKGNWNIGKTGYSLTTAPPTATENADALLNRDMSAVSDTNARSPLNALRFIRNKWSTSGTTLTVCKENDVDAAWTATVSTNAAADPIVGNDPA